MSLNFKHMFILIIVFVILTGSTFLYANSQRERNTVVLTGLNLGEKIGREYPSLTEQDLSGLKSGIIHTQEGKTKYSQYLRFKAADFETGYFLHGEDNFGRVGDFLFWVEDEPMFEYEVQFHEGFESRVRDNELIDIEDENLRMLDAIFNVVRAEIDPDRKEVELIMVGGKKDQLLMREGETKVLTFGGRRTVISVLYISDGGREPRVILRVNGVDSKPLEQGDTASFPDGTFLGVAEVLPAEAGEEIRDMVVLSGGAGGSKIRLRDTDFTDNSFATGKVEVNGQNIEDGKVMILGQIYDNNQKFRISSIRYRLLAHAKGGGDVYVPPNHGLREYLFEPEGMLVDNFEIISGGIKGGGTGTRVPSNLIRLQPKGDDRYNLVFTNVRGQTYNIPFVTTENGFGYGYDKGTLHFQEGGGPPVYPIARNDFFVATNRNDISGFTNVLRYTGYNSASNTLSFEDLASGSYSTVIDPATGEGNVVIGGQTYSVYVDTANPDAPIAVDLTGDNGWGDEANVVVMGGGIIDLGPGAMRVTTLERMFDEPAGDEEISITIIDGGDYVNADVPDQADIDMLEASGDEEQGMSRYGVLVKVLERGGSDDPDEIQLFYPVSGRRAVGQAVGRVAVTLEREKLVAR
ncbi:hypothetical protein GF371_01905 [Candidatus Woesearchaeota archaeon]|nr:hypothetical protein [Candidatus Woesearchaeota archaeon]